MLIGLCIANSSMQSADFINIAFHKSACINSCREVGIIHHLEVLAASLQLFWCYMQLRSQEVTNKYIYHDFPEILIHLLILQVTVPWLIIFI